MERGLPCSITSLEHVARDQCEDLFLAENFEKMIQARTDIAAGNGETRWMNQRANFYAKIGRRRFECRFEFVRTKT